MMSAEMVLAYVGPGPGLGITWALIGLLVTLFSAVVAVMLWPLRMLMARMRGGSSAEAEPVPEHEQAEPSVSTADDLPGS